MTCQCLSNCIIKYIEFNANEYSNNDKAIFVISFPFFFFKFNKKKIVLARVNKKKKELYINFKMQLSQTKEKWERREKLKMTLRSIYN